MLLIEFKSAYFQNAVFISSASQNRVTSGQRGTPVSWSKPTGVPLCSIRIIPQAMYNLNIFQNPCELLVPSCHFLVEASFALCIRARNIEPLCSLFVLSLISSYFAVFSSHTAGIRFEPYQSPASAPATAAVVSVSRPRSTALKTHAGAATWRNCYNPLTGRNW